MPGTAVRGGFLEMDKRVAKIFSHEKGRAIGGGEIS
jgi:hypothetical protein